MATCEHCYYSRSVGNPNAVLCCRYPPTILKVEDKAITSYFPLVNLTAWCGEWRGRKPPLGMAGSKSDPATSKPPPRRY